MQGRVTHNPDRPRILIVLATARSGSNLLVSYLDSLPDVSSWGELLDPDYWQGIPRGVGRDALHDHLLAVFATRPASINSFKIIFDQLCKAGLALNDLRELFPDARYIVLYRRDLFAQFVSVERAKLTDEWVKPDAGSARRVTLKPTRNQFLYFRKVVREQYAQALRQDWLRRSALILDYETLAQSPQTVFDQRIIPWLGLGTARRPALLRLLPGRSRTEPARVSTRLEKQITEPLSELVENYPEFADLIGQGDSLQYY
jgi:LPS sulfotransferase NodH